MLHVYTGGGKGKTTAALGLALRMLGHGKKVLVCQFLKDGTSGELEALSQFRNATIWVSGDVQGFYSRMSVTEQEKTRKLVMQEIEGIQEALSMLQPDMILLDELAEAISIGCVNEEAGMELVREAMKYGEVVVTGQKAPKAMIQLADYVSDIQCVRHPYAKGVDAREGIEY